MLSPIKLIKSKKYFDQIQVLVKGITLKNWKTTLHGLIIAGLLLSKIWAPTEMQPKINDTIMALTATGFFVTKDFNVHSTSGEVVDATKKEMNK